MRWRTIVCMSGAVEAISSYTAGLAIRGTLPHPLVAIVGTRTPTAEAAQAAFAVAQVLAAAGVGVVSGLALGIDAAAHRGCLAGGGKTVAVLGHGLETPLYPAEHAALADVIARHGALASPFAPEEPLTRGNLLARNRWIASLACAVWVVQTGVPGGALAAAAHARRLEIPVFTTQWDEPRWQAGYDSLRAHGAIAIDPHTAAAHLEHCCATAPMGNRQGMLAL